MKKTLIIFTLLSILTIGVFAADNISEYELPTSDCKASYYKNGDYWLLQGFEFECYDPDRDPDLLTIVDNEINKITKSPYNKRYAVVGHSQGGPRALAYATRLKQTKSAAEYNNLVAAITVSGIDKGIKALDGGFGGFKTKLTKDIDILAKGVDGTLGALDIFGFKRLFFGYGLSADDYILKLVISVNDTTATNLLTDFTVWVIEMVSDNKNIEGPAKYVPRGWRNESYDRIEQLYDMMPRSKFIDTYVTGSTTKTCKYQSGTKQELYWASKKVGFITLKYLALRTVPVYKTYTYSVDTPRFDSKLPVGYIVGLDNNTFGMMDKMNDDGTIDKSTSKNIKKACDITGTVFAVAGGLNVAESVISYSTLNIISGTTHAIDAVKCTRAADLCFNVNDYLNDIKGSNENDGLVAKESQYIPMVAVDKNNVKTEVHSNVLGDTNKGFVGYPQYNHRFTEPVIYESAAKHQPLKDSPDQTVNKMVTKMIAEAKTRK